jgi:hypothetical protein
MSTFLEPILNDLEPFLIKYKASKYNKTQEYYYGIIAPLVPVVYHNYFLLPMV